MNSKTWLAIINTSAAGQAPISVFTGARWGLLCSAWVAVGIGGAIGLALPAKILRVVVGISFLVCGLWFLLC